MIWKKIFLLIAISSITAKQYLKESTGDALIVIQTKDTQSSQYNKRRLETAKKWTTQESISMFFIR